MSYLWNLLERLRLLKMYTLTPLSYHGWALIYIRRVLRKKRVSRLLDVGCGHGFTMELIRRFYRGYAVGLDVNLTSLKEAKRKNVHDDLVLGDAASMPFLTRSFGLAVAVEIIEHMEKCRGNLMLKELDRTAISQVLTTHVGFSPLRVDEPGWSHRSGWYSEELEDIGYSCKGAPGYYEGKGLLLKLLSAAAQRIALPIIFFKPKLAEHMICTKSYEILIMHRAC